MILNKTNLSKVPTNKVAYWCKRLLIIILLFHFMMSAKADTIPFRRSISPSNPMWLIHIDTWAHQPQQVIDLIPADIRPFVVMNISLSTTVLKDEGYACADSWLNTCAQNGIWAMIQPSSGISNVFLSDTAFSLYESFYKQYPNFIGYNFCEQAWGFDNTTFPLRLGLYIKLLQLGKKYGGYLYINDDFSISNNIYNTVAKFKRNKPFADSTIAYKDNMIYGDKFTNSIGYYDNESGALGAFLSGHASNYAVRYDQYSWPWSGRAKVFGPEILGRDTANGNRALWGCPESVMGVPIVEHILLTGATVIDGPEIPWMTTTYGKDTLPAFTNMLADIYRKIIDGAIRIPTFHEVIARTKIAYVNDVDYNTTDSLFTGLYAIDGTLKNNRTWFKKSGRYPSIPEFALSTIYEISPFQTTIKKSEYSKRWITNQAKINEFNSLFPEEYKGDMFVSRVANSWFSYNPYINTDTVATANIPLKYNTCDSISLAYSAHTFSVINESANQLKVYLNNYRTDKNYLWNQYPNDFSWYTLQTAIFPDFIAHTRDSALRNSVIKIYGCQNLPSYSLADRGKHLQSIATTSWINGVFTLTISHNGPVDLTINCSGIATNRLSEPAPPQLYAAPNPPVYTGYKMYEAEGGTVTWPANVSTAFPHYHGTRYVNFSSTTSSSSAVTFKIINVQNAGTYQLQTRYSTPVSQLTNVNKVDIYVNGSKIGTPSFAITGIDSVWALNTQNVNLNAGTNTIMFKANAKGAQLNIDNIMLTAVIPVPVSFISLDVNEIKGSRVLLNWSVADEQEMLGYKIQKSKDGINFNLLSEQAASNLGNNNYSFIDDANTGFCYYSIKGISKSGQVTYSKVVKIFMAETSREIITVSPNPVSGNKIMLLFSNVSKGDYAISLHDLFGRRLITKVYQHIGGDGTTEVYLPSISAGKYQIEIKSDKKQYSIPVITLK